MIQKKIMFVSICADLDLTCAAFVLRLCEYGDADKTEHLRRLLTALILSYLEWSATREV